MGCCSPEKSVNYKYEIIQISKREIGKGGYGKTFLQGLKLINEEKEIIRYYVYKEINYNGEKDYNFMKKFLYESSMMVGLFHKNLVKIYGIFLKYNRLYMEYLSGGNLEEKMSRNEIIPFDSKIHILLEIADGLIALHNPQEYLNPLGIDHSPIVHADLKPANILLSEDRYPNVKITDFGISGIIKEELKGLSFEYSDPTIFKGKENRILDTRYDVYSYGIILCELLWNKKAQLKQGGPIPIFEPNDANDSNIPDELKEIYLKCIKKKEERPTMKEIKQALLDYCNNSNDEQLKKIAEKNMNNQNVNIARKNLDAMSTFKQLPLLLNKFSQIFKEKFFPSDSSNIGKYTLGKGTPCELEYLGIWKDGLIDEFGTFIFKNLGIKYIGQHKNGSFNGYGKIIGLKGSKADGVEIVGSFKNFSLEGYGSLKFKGFSHEGLYKDGIQNGIGIFCDPEGRKFEGEFKNGQFDGIGKFFDFLQNYQGEFKENERNGFGIFTYNDNSCYEGEFVKAKFEGIGNFKIDEDCGYEGHWKKGIPCGPGFYKHKTKENEIKTEKINKNNNE